MTGGCSASGSDGSNRSTGGITRTASASSGSSGWLGGRVRPIGGRCFGGSGRSAGRIRFHPRLENNRGADLGRQERHRFHQGEAREQLDLRHFWLERAAASAVQIGSCSAVECSAVEVGSCGAGGSVSTTGSGGADASAATGSGSDTAAHRLRLGYGGVRRSRRFGRLGVRQRNRFGDRLGCVGFRRRSRRHRCGQLLDHQLQHRDGGRLASRRFNVRIVGKTKLREHA